MSIIAEKRSIVNKFRCITSFPDPAKDDENYKQFHNLDIEEMNRPELVKALREAELKLLFLERPNRILHIENTGHVTAESWLQDRLVGIKGLLKGKEQAKGRDQGPAPRGGADGWI